MNNKPVAWYKKDSNDYLIENIGQPDFQVQEFIDAGYISLYTHPVNTCKHGVDDGACKECYLEATHPVKVNYECNSSEQNKPIVYWDGKHFASKDKSSLADIPLYTAEQLHPIKENCCPDCGCHFTGEYPFNYTVKELTDEEIHECWEMFMGTDDYTRIDIARAIIRKAQEK